jgi:hypothetical protein
MPASGSGPEPASAEEQALYDQFVAQALEVAFDRGQRESLREQLTTGDDPVEATAFSSAAIVKRTMDMAREAGQEIPADVALHGGTEVFSEIAAYAQRLGAGTFFVDEQGNPADPDDDNAVLGPAGEAAHLRALDHARQLMEADGTLPKEAAMQDFQQLVEADKAGALDEMLANAARPVPAEEGTPPPAQGKGARR